jgi:hypothetical protein
MKASVTRSLGASTLEFPRADDATTAGKPIAPSAAAAAPFRKDRRSSFLAREIMMDSLERLTR